MTFKWTAPIRGDLGSMESEIYEDGSPEVLMYPLGMDKVEAAERLGGDAQSACGRFERVENAGGRGTDVPIEARSNIQLWQRLDQNSANVTAMLGASFDNSAGVEILGHLGMLLADARALEQIDNDDNDEAAMVFSSGGVG